MLTTIIPRWCSGLQQRGPYRLLYCTLTGSGDIDWRSNAPRARVLSEWNNSPSYISTSDDLLTVYRVFFFFLLTRPVYDREKIADGLSKLHNDKNGEAFLGSFSKAQRAVTPLLMFSCAIMTTGVLFYFRWVSSKCFEVLILKF